MERDFVRWLCNHLPAHPRLLVGPGDDAAILRLAADENLVATTDMLMDGVDFVLGQHEPEKIGRKALAVNLSDLAAMAARPMAALVSVALPRQGGEALAKRLYEGLLPLAAKFDCPIAGGDTNSWDGPLVISVTAFGEVPPERRWRRSGARPRDAILVTGQFGGSIHGRQFDFLPRIEEALWLAENATVHAAIDVSDGLSLDLSRLCEASACGAILEMDQIPVSAAADGPGRLDATATPLAPSSDTFNRRAHAAQDATGIPPVASPNSPLDHALSDGEDFELILAVPREVADHLIATQPLPTPLTKIGEFIEQPGLFARGTDGQRTPLTPRGYEHHL